MVARNTNTEMTNTISESAGNDGSRKSQPMPSVPPRRKRMRNIGGNTVSGTSA